MSINALRTSGRAVGAVIGTACLLLGVAPAAAGTVTAARADTPPGAPPGVCPADTGWGPPLPGTALSASRVQSGFQFLEGPVWVADPGYLLVSDLAPATGAEQVQPSTIRRLVPPAPAETFVANAGSNGLALTPDGQRILAATHDNRTVSAFQLSDRARSVVAADYQGRAFNSPNDVTVRADGVVYFTDPSFQRGRRPDAMGGRTGVFRVVNGQVALVDNSVRQPNGIALSPDGSTLYVGAFGENRIYAYQVRPDGSTGQAHRLRHHRQPGRGDRGLRGQRLLGLAQRGPGARVLAERRRARHDLVGHAGHQRGFRRDRPPDPLHHGRPDR